MIENIIAFIVSLTVSVGGFLGIIPDQPNVGGFSDPFLSIQLAPNPSNGDCLTTDGTSNAWGSCGEGGGGGGSTLHVDAGDYVYPHQGDYHSAPRYVATSSTASSFSVLDVTNVFSIPSGTNRTANDNGELTHDTSDNQLIMDDLVIGRATEKIWGVTIASTSPAFISEGLLKIPSESDGYTMTIIQCSVEGGTSKTIAVEDASGDSTEDITCGTSVTTDDGSITNSTVTAGEEMYIDFGATSGSVDYVSITVHGRWTRE